MIDYDLLPKECAKCSKPVTKADWRRAIGKFGALSSIMHPSSKVIYICECGNKMYSGILSDDSHRQSTTGGNNE